jgi:cell division septation protein DedD
MALIAGRVVLVGLAVIALPTTLADVADIVFREDTAALTQVAFMIE